MTNFKFRVAALTLVSCAYAALLACSSPSSPQQVADTNPPPAAAPAAAPAPEAAPEPAPPAEVAKPEPAKKVAAKPKPKPVPAAAPPAPAPVPAAAPVPMDTGTDQVVSVQTQPTLPVGAAVRVVNGAVIPK
jgi:outer membrane biosynthesis protein TonB